MSNKAQIRKLGKLVDQITQVVEALEVSNMIDKTPSDTEDVARAGAITNPDEMLETLRGMVSARRLRSKVFGENLFFDPAWDILLFLMVAQLSGQKVMVSQLMAAAHVPPTTGLRWLQHLVDAGWVERHPAKRDRRRIFLRLSDKMMAAFTLWYERSFPLDR